MAKILIGCECSGTVRDAFARLGHDAFSCDLKPCEKNGNNHIQCDVIEAIFSLYSWDFIGLHPDCTALAVSGNAHYSKGKPGWKARIDAVEWTVMLWNMACSVSSKVYLENPVGVLGSLGGLGKCQIIQPYNFGHDASKSTCLWLKGLPNLKSTQYVEPRVVGGKNRWSNQTDSGQNVLTPSEQRKTERSRTYEGIAKAMAEQWSPLLD